VSEPLDRIFKAVVIGSGGPFGKDFFRKLATGGFSEESDDWWRIGADICFSVKEIESFRIKLVLWHINDSDKYRSLQRAYYLNASMIFLLVENSNSENVHHYRRLVNDFYKVAERHGRKVPLAIVSNKNSNINLSTVNELAREFNASYIILDFNDDDELEKATNQMIREWMS
jgi:GTPase SAR1 family protein